MSEKQDFLNWKINKGLYGWDHEYSKLIDEAYDKGKAASAQGGACEHGIRHPHPCRECEDREPPEVQSDAQ